MDWFDLLSLVALGLILLWIAGWLLWTYWPSGASSPVGQLVLTASDKSQGGIGYLALEALKLDDVLSSDASSLSAIAYLQSRLLKEFRKSWAKEDETLGVDETSTEENPADANAETIHWGPEK